MNNVRLRASIIFFVILLQISTSLVASTLLDILTAASKHEHIFQQARERLPGEVQKDLISTSDVTLGGEDSSGAVLRHHVVRRRIRTGSSLRLTSKTGWNLAVSAEGAIYGALDFDPNTHLRISTIDLGIVVIQGVASQKYIAIDDSGRAITTDDISPTNYFIEELGNSYYTTFKPLSHFDDGWCLGISRSGHVMRNRRQQGLAYTSETDGHRHTRSRRRGCSFMKIPSSYRG